MGKPSLSIGILSSIEQWKKPQCSFQEFLSDGLPQTFLSGCNSQQTCSFFFLSFFFLSSIERQVSLHSSSESAVYSILCFTWLLHCGRPCTISVLNECVTHMSDTHRTRIQLKRVRVHLSACEDGSLGIV